MNSVILHLSAGQGPMECKWVVTQLATMFRKEATAQGMKCEIIEPTDSPVASLLMSVTGKGCKTFAEARTGTIRWIGQSPFRPKHKRKNWYVGVKPAPDVEGVPELKEAEIKYQAIRASGPGGQHVNKTDSAVRATHIPTGISVVSQDQRSQFANKKIARLKLALVFEEKRELSASKTKEGMWKQNLELQRGNEVRAYEGVKFRLRK